MHAPICAICLKSDVLCSGCQQKLDSGSISQCDVDVSRFLHSIEDKFRALESAKLLKSMEGDTIILVAGPGDGAKLVGKQGSVVKLLAKHFNKPIKVIEFLQDIKNFVREMIPQAVVNIVYTNEGEKYKILARGRISNKEEIESTIKYFFGKPAEVVII